MYWVLVFSSPRQFIFSLFLCSSIHQSATFTNSITLLPPSLFCPAVWRSIELLLFNSTSFFLSLSIHLVLFVCLSVCLSNYLSIYLSIFLSVCLSFNQSSCFWAAAPKGPMTYAFTQGKFLLNFLLQCTPPLEPKPQPNLSL